MVSAHYTCLLNDRCVDIWIRLLSEWLVLAQLRDALWGHTHFESSRIVIILLQDVALLSC